MARFARLYRLAGVLPLLGMLFIQQTAWACPTCKQAVSINGADTVSGYFWSILFMMSMPFLIFGGMSLYFYLLVRRARAEAAAAATVAAGVPADSHEWIGA
ncbi:hypothetical protein [Lignipirellula cremea]|uniref:Uncharacterized protein n=1 Tax=Lignipirellula cremea TaxID=2528010 RepID=A0A518E2Z7_9BACT|nr:hypothetical protein [Lignipirellula cremea]QDU98465.1 hypothetical protein Pla8534_63330 [Lignipirellula cremea]